jgi:hypothetical protein
MKKTQNWFDVDRAGLAKILRRKGVEFAVFELIQNAWDEVGVTEVKVALSECRGGAMLSVSDDAPEGFKDIAHAYTLFAESAKKANAEQRGRFNLGEKLVLAICHHAMIQTTKGTVLFGANGRVHKPELKTKSGSVIQMELKLTKKEIAEVGDAVQRLLPPLGIKTVYNGVEIEHREPDAVVNEILPTEVADGEGRLVWSKRRTNVFLYDKVGDTARVYEMGVPVVEHDCAFDCDVQQKIPLTIDRDNVAPSFLRKLHAAVFNETHARLDVEEMNNEWAQTAVESPEAKPEAVEDYVTKRFGEKRVSFDMNDPEANNKAVASGYTLVHGGMMSGDAWKNVKSGGDDGVPFIQPAGQLFPTNSPDLRSAEPLDESETTDGMKAVVMYAEEFAKATIGVSINVRLVKQPTREAACYGTRTLTFNVRNLGGARWFDLTSNRVAIDDLIIHELGHEWASNHLSEDYYNALTKIGARAMKAVREGRLA